MVVAQVWGGGGESTGGLKGERLSVVGGRKWQMGIYKQRRRTGVLQVDKSNIGINTGSSSGSNVVVLGEENNRRAVQRQ